MSFTPPIFCQENEENNSKFVDIQQSQNTSRVSEVPLQNLRLASQEVLQKAQQSGRSKCLRCGGSRMFYCYTCYVPVENVPIEKIPLVKLPLKIDIIKHPNEIDGKSTAVHAKLLAPEFVNIYTYPCIPEYEEKDHEVALVFPGPKSVSIKEISSHLQKRIQNNVRGASDDLDKPSIKRKKTEGQDGCDLNDSKWKGIALKKIIFIDSTWNQTNKILTDERLQGLLQVELKSRKTCFWRHQKGKPDTFLSTIEAIYCFLVDYHTEILKEKYTDEITVQKDLKLNPGIFRSLVYPAGWRRKPYDKFLGDTTWRGRVKDCSTPINSIRPRQMRDRAQFSHQLNAATSATPAHIA